MAKAKAISVKKEEKLITLTKEQFQKLRQIQDIIDTEINDLKDAVADTDLEPIELGFNIGSVHSTLYEACNNLENILDAVDPIESVDWSWDEEEN